MFFSGDLVRAGQDQPGEIRALSFSVVRIWNIDIDIEDLSGQRESSRENKSCGFRQISDENI